MKQYLDLMRHVRERGVHKGDRTGTGTLSVFGCQMRFDLGAGFPVVTTKSVHMRSVIHELLWFLQGSTNIGYLHANRVSIWDEWADDRGGAGSDLRRAVAELVCFDLQPLRAAGADANWLIQKQFRQHIAVRLRL